MARKVGMDSTIDPNKPHRYESRFGDEDDTYCYVKGCNATAAGAIHIMATNRIVIERREFIGEVIEGNGSENMITAAFKIAGEYISDHDDASGVEVAFDYAGRTFKATLLPDGEG